MPQRRRLAQLLVESGLLDRAQVRAALAQQRRQGRSLGHVVVSHGLVDEAALVQALAEAWHLPVASLHRKPPEQSALAKLDASFCRRHGCIPLRLDPRGDRLDVALTDPTATELLDLINVKTRCVVSPYVAGPSAIDAAIRQHYLGEQPEADVALRHRMPTGPMPRGPVDPAKRRERRGAESGLTGPAFPAACPQSIPASAPSDQEPAVPARPVPIQAVPDARPGPKSRGNTPTSVPTAPARASTSAAATLSPDEAKELRRELDELRQANLDLASTVNELEGQVQRLEAQSDTQRRESADLRDLLARDERVLQRVLGLLVDAGVCTRETLLERLNDQDKR